MKTPLPQFLSVGTGQKARRIAVLKQAGRGPAVVWLGGFRSDMRATKAEALAQWAAREGREHLYLGYWIRGHRKMDYKRRFQPLEGFDGRQWRPMRRADPA